MSDKNKKRRKVRKDHNYEYLKRVKEKGECLICFSKEKLTFHHRIPKKKKNTVTNIAKTYSFSALKRELNKCDLLCEECHRLIHKMGLSKYQRFKKYFGIKRKIYR